MIENKEASFNLLKNSNFRPLIESNENVGNYIFYNTGLQRN